ncbi:hypothetical protein SPF06_06360 [Sinomonas sp. JGH33]|uniref:IPT/TIG domain-containing protein n=1 Tax=Sinomonas terricola TaxID=3110330 RepID=A0ABU5T3V7_9MICC|nr:hypothetical protein [Sinomonas sp. JGH33]MEA5454339.1 hypothetical protein [Sinomonas sp. JGH33]
MLALAACGSPVGPAGGGADRASSDSTTAQAAPLPTVQPQAGPGAPQKLEPVIWLPPGPASPADPPAGVAYLDTAAFHCADAAASAAGTGAEAVWSAVAAVCSALVDGSATSWGEASASMSAVADQPARRCLEVAALAAARRVMSFHRDHPEASIPLGPASAEACPRQLTGATELDAGGRPLGPSSLRPSGPVVGGTVLAFDGFTGAVSTVMFDGRPVDPDAVQLAGANSFDRVTVVMPPASRPGSVKITLGGPLPIAGTVEFTYLASGSTAAP